MKLVLIMRGIPGSGKSTLAQYLATAFHGAIHSTDDFFYVDGRYCFDVTKLHENHDRNYEAFCRSLAAGVPVVICDNTNTQRWHFQRYTEAAAKTGYQVAFVVLPHPPAEIAAKRTAHGVPTGTIRRMIEEWED